MAKQKKQLMNKIVKETSDGRLLLQVNKKIYEVEAVMQAAYRFNDRCYIHIDPITKDVMGVYFKAKETTKINLEDIAYNFCNELIDQQLNLMAEKKYGKIRDEIIKKAFSKIE